MEAENQILRPKNIKTILLAVISLAFTIAGVFMTKDENLTGWLAALFFGLCFIVFLIQLIPGSTQLKLTQQGFIMTSLFRSHFTKWSDVKSFKIGYLGMNKTVMFDYADTYKKQEIGKSIAKALSDSHGAIPSTYGLKATELLYIMNDWKNKYGAQQTPTKSNS